MGTYLQLCDFALRLLTSLTSSMASDVQRISTLEGIVALGLGGLRLRVIDFSCSLGRPVRQRLAGGHLGSEPF